MAKCPHCDKGKVILLTSVRTCEKCGGTGVDPATTKWEPIKLDFSGITTMDASGGEVVRSFKVEGLTFTPSRVHEQDIAGELAIDVTKDVQSSTLAFTDERYRVPKIGDACPPRSARAYFPTEFLEHFGVTAFLLEQMTREEAHSLLLLPSTVKVVSVVSDFRADQAMLVLTGEGLPVECSLDGRVAARYRRDNSGKPVFLDFQTVSIPANARIENILKDRQSSKLPAVDLSRYVVLTRKTQFTPPCVLAGWLREAMNVNGRRMRIVGASGVSTYPGAWLMQIVLDPTDEGRRSFYTEHGPCRVPELDAKIVADYADLIRDGWERQLPDNPLMSVPKV